jgi:hypothetical protein
MGPIFAEANGDGKTEPATRDPWRRHLDAAGRVRMMGGTVGGLWRTEAPAILASTAPVREGWRCPVVLERLHAAVAALFVVAIVVQVFLAGAALANLGGSGDFATHIEFGYSWIGIAALALILTALAARRPRREVGIALALLVLYVVQTALPGFHASAPWVAALHPVNALFLFGLAAWYARRAWRAAMS